MRYLGLALLLGTVLGGCSSSILQKPESGLSGRALCERKCNDTFETCSVNCSDDQYCINTICGAPRSKCLESCKATAR